MESAVKTFNELTLEELYEILKVRAEVFVVEQNCAYQDLDELDKFVLHVYIRDESGIQAYLRVIEAGRAYDETAIGRVLSKKRRCGLGTEIVRLGISAAKERMGAEKIRIAAHVYARGLYEKLGFRQCGGEFLEDGIPHIEMLLEPV